MVLTNVALYEVLKPEVGENAARMIAEVVPPAQDLATKADVALLRSEFGLLRTELRSKIEIMGANLRAEMHAGNATTIKWMLGFFIPVWIGTWATVAAVILKG